MYRYRGQTQDFRPNPASLQQDLKLRVACGERSYDARRRPVVLISPTLIVAAIIAFYLLTSIKILNEYERAVVFRLGKLLDAPKGPGVILIFAPIDRMVRVSLRTIVMDVPPQDVITRDNVSVKVNAVI